VCSNILVWFFVLEVFNDIVQTDVGTDDATEKTKNKYDEIFCETLLEIKRIVPIGSLESKLYIFFLLSLMLQTNKLVTFLLRDFLPTNLQNRADLNCTAILEFCKYWMKVPVGDKMLCLN